MLTFRLPFPSSWMETITNAESHSTTPVVPNPVSNWMVIGVGFVIYHNDCRDIPDTSYAPGYMVIRRKPIIKPDSNVLCRFKWRGHTIKFNAYTIRNYFHSTYTIGNVVPTAQNVALDIIYNQLPPHICQDLGKLIKYI